MSVALQTFRERVAEMERPEILATGMKPWEGSPIKDNSVHAPHAIWINTDIEPGEGVDIVGDLQTMWETTEKRYDAIFSEATLEHIERPWVAMHSMAWMLKPGGILYLQTHQTFPLHGYPDDHFRFSDRALATMARDSGLHILEVSYAHPCRIIPPREIRRWNTLAKAYLNVDICAIKPE